MNVRGSRFWLDALWVIAYLGIFYLVKIKTDFWSENHWVGFLLGALFALVILLQGTRFVVGFLTRQIHLRLGIGCLVLSILSLVSFIRGGDSNTGFATFFFLTFGVQNIYAYRHANKMQANSASPIVNNG